MSGLSSQSAFWEAFWSLFDAAMAQGVDPAHFTPGRVDTGKARPSAAAVVAFAADAYRIDMAQLCGPRRDRHLVEARALAVWGLRNAGIPWSYAAIGNAMGGRDHSTIVNLIKRADQFRKHSPRFAGACEDLRRAFHIEETASCPQLH